LTENLYSSPSADAGLLAILEVPGGPRMSNTLYVITLLEFPACMF